VTGYLLTTELFMAPTPYDALRIAIKAANVNGDADFAYSERTAAIAAVTVKQLHVEYKSGNEYLRLDRLIAALSECADLQLCEYRGRGGDDGQRRLVCDVTFDGDPYQLVYHLD
jgi:hypothetical protein